jgi:histone-lysine N-methyltransferase SETMAR
LFNFIFIIVVKPTLTNKKNLVTIFWDSKGVLLTDVLPCGQTITALYYCSLLDKLRNAVQEKRRRRMLDGNLYLLQDNARPHTAQATKAKLSELHLNVIPHPPYSPDLSPSDYYLFSPLKSALRGKHFTCSNEVELGIHDWIASKPEDFFASGINKLPERWQRCIDHVGSYFEHLRDFDE